MQNKEIFPSKPCTIETIDTGFVEHLENEFNIHVFTNSGFRKVPIIWVGAERAFQTKNDASIRDSSGKLILPVITVERTSLQKDPAFKGAVQAHITPEKSEARDYLGGAFKFVTKLNQEKTAQLQRARNSRQTGPNHAFGVKYSTELVFDEYLVPIPVYVSITYSITLRCEYQQQMNQMILPFISKTGQINHFVFKKDNHRFESFIQQDFSATNNLSAMSEDERKFQTKIDIKVLGYVIGLGDNEPRPKIVKRESVARLLTPVETVFTPVRSRAAFNKSDPDLERGVNTCESTKEVKVINGVKYIEERVTVLDEIDSSVVTATYGKGHPAFEKDSTSITDLIDGVRAGAETDFRMGEVSISGSISNLYKKVTTGKQTVCADDDE